jgi:integrase
MRLKLRRALRLAGRADLLQALGPGHASQPREVIVSDEEYERALEHAPPALGIMLRLAREAGLRFESARTLTAAQIDLAGRTINLRGKGKRNVCVPISRALEKELRRYVNMKKPPDWPLTGYARGGKAPNRSAIASAMHKLRKRCGLSVWGLHDLRRTAARRLYERTRDLWKVRAFLGHESLTTTLWYLGNRTAGLGPEDLEETEA